MNHILKFSIHPVLTLLKNKPSHISTEKLIWISKWFQTTANY